jgi:prolyl-tRNA synthetase
MFLRTSEFLWQEGHTAHVDHGDAAAYARRIHMDVYRDFLVNVLAVPVHVGQKTAAERFAGATNSLTCEGIMRDGKALQMATSHELGQNFARAFDITYSTAEGDEQHAWTTSWGSSSRMVGGLIMAHGDERGMRTPPRVAPVQAVVVVVRDEDDVLDQAGKLADSLADAGVRTKVDKDVHVGFGRRLTDWELKGVPVRLELGPRDVKEGNATLVRRDREGKETVPLDRAAAAVRDLLGEIQDEMLKQATEFRDSVTSDVDSVEEAAEAGEAGAARIAWDVLGAEGERELLSRGVSVRCLQRADGTIPDDTDEPDLVAIVARAY